MPIRKSYKECSKPERQYAKALVESYFFMMTKGCGNGNCQNRLCRSCESWEVVTPNEAAAKSLLIATTAPLKLCLPQIPTVTFTSLWENGPETNDYDSSFSETDDNEEEEEEEMFITASPPSTPRKRLSVALQLDHNLSGLFYEHKPIKNSRDRLDNRFVFSNERLV